MNTAALSFDNGPDLDGTPLVLDALRSRGLRATFFPIGLRLDDPALRRLAEQAHDEGHWIGNHTLSHSVPLGLLRPAEARAEIDSAQARLGRLAHPDRLFRPHDAGSISPRLLSRPALAHLSTRHFTIVLWNVLPQDWIEPEGWVERALAACSTTSRALVVLHDVSPAAMRQLPRFLDELAARDILVVQELPADCLPLLRGARRGALEGRVCP
jgi:peptidoglycan/xylan/chitin deacetylase (PgdA/CDA1 family)